ncbi:MAG: phosphatase PAP2 family protein [Alistipes sp.]|nr:phosphatase PAP2 family protein [Alistipes sp.]
MMDNNEYSQRQGDAGPVDAPIRGGAALTLSRLISIVMNPLLMPFFGVLVLLYGTGLNYLPGKIKMYYILVVLLNTCVVPVICIGLLHSIGVVKGVTLGSRRDRVLPLLITALSYVLCAFMIKGLFGAVVVQRFLLAGAACITLAFIVTFYWKISIHMIAAGGTLALVIFLEHFGLGRFMPAVIAMVAGCGALASARMYLGAHTPLQVAAGFAGGFAVSLLVITL